ncbi:GGDEF domain-containing protein [Streptomyces monomycini]|uniref:GGDEF domain-containing protein n=1 Tax=Streptomyces monomycini TaxID=371720 RepID=UPI0004AB3DF4|nr:GGDEF domain-containing protein [Streptomyces monomycini]
MGSILRARPRFGQHALLVTTAAVPVAGWSLHAVALHRRLAAARKCQLTGLPGRPELLAYGDRLLRTGRRDTVHLVLLDGDGFKAVNDAHGHAAGDAVIRALGRRLARWCTGRRALAARLGGDEFAVATALPPAAALAELAALREQLQQPLRYEGLTLRLGVSAGIARAADLPGEPCSRLLRGADAAMYQVKNGRAVFPYCASRADAYAETVNGRRLGRRGAAQPERAA